MGRLTTNKPVDEMSMLELVYNSCCVGEDGSAMYKDFETVRDARDFVRKLYMVHLNEEMPTDDDIFDESMIDELQYEPEVHLNGLIALFYRNLWAMADLRETLKDYEDREEQGLLIELPCKVGDTVYVYNYCDYVCTSRDWETGIEECPFENECEFEECKEGNERLFKTAIDSIWNNGQGWEFSVRGLHLEISINAIGKTVFLTRSEAEEALAEQEEKKETRY